MMTEKYPTWLTGHVKEWAEKRLRSGAGKSRRLPCLHDAGIYPV